MVYRSAATDLVAGTTDVTNSYDLFVTDVSTLQTTLITHAAGAPLVSITSTSYNYGEDFNSIINRDGTKIIFSEYVSNVVANDLNGNNSEDVFRFDLLPRVPVVTETGPGTSIFESSGVDSYTIKLPTMWTFPRLVGAELGL